MTSPAAIGSPSRKYLHSSGHRTLSSPQRSKSALLDKQLRIAQKAASARSHRVVPTFEANCAKLVKRRDDAKLKEKNLLLRRLLWRLRRRKGKSTSLRRAGGKFYGKTRIMMWIGNGAGCLRGVPPRIFSRDASRRSRRCSAYRILMMMISELWDWIDIMIALGLG
ncbi:hypothetical protein BT96DRAFT_227531 [Gymnopus androsaceus JB14]|uniref:Uncharacterized protein n=1 Tax=Gymnopus androsaceus JB14 TaxID=1447944 RepID=A0A6A4H6C2_9AGAR|nr:hypothetical protein BT96DRAFT_227531 [Gymnopus androsaceus JB14]